MTTKSYHELIRIPTFEERLKYLSLHGGVGEVTFGGHRHLNQLLYKSERWKKVKRQVVIRDNGCDLAHPDYPILASPIYIHHINPITIEDLLEDNPIVFDMDNLVSVCFSTHQDIHYGTCCCRTDYHERTPYDTCPWKTLA